MIRQSMTLDLDVDAETPDSDERDLENVQSIVDSVLRRVLGANDPDYEDLLQTAIENVLATMGRGSFRGDCPLKGWAAAIARNVAVDALRARMRDRRLFSRGEDEEVLFQIGEVGQGPEHMAEVRRQLRQFEGALSCLRPSKATVVYMHDVLGHDLAEVAAAVGTSVAAAQSRLIRGRREIVVRMTAPGRSARRNLPARADDPSSVPDPAIKEGTLGGSF
jgi:RNA polymerase sigma-70 factor (ECF subfamily)